MKREEIARVFIEDAMSNMGDSFSLLFSSEEFHYKIMETALQIHPNDTQLYYPMGIIPPTVSLINQKLYTGFCLPIILERSKELDEESFLKFLMYWTFRVKLRVIKHAELVSVAEKGEGYSLVDDLLLEEMVEAEMISIGFPSFF